MNSRRILKKLFGYTPKIQFGKPHEPIVRPFPSIIDENGNAKLGDNVWNLMKKPDTINFKRGRGDHEFDEDDYDFIVGDTWFLDHEKVGSIKL